MSNELPEPEFVQVVSTVDSESAARDLARKAVERRLAACAQVYGPVDSTYWWQGTIHEATEWYCLLKTTAGKYRELEQMIKSNHPYSVPEVLAFPILAGNQQYLEWLRQNTEQ